MENLMENLSPEQIMELREKRRQMFEQMGIKNVGQMMTESTVAAGSKNMNILQKIQQIKSGAAKSELSKYVNAAAKPSSLLGSQGFDPIPVSKPKKGSISKQQSVDPKNRVEVQNFSTTVSNIDNSELAAIDAMFGGDTPKMKMSSQQMAFDSGQPIMQQRPMQLDLDLTLSQMPMFNPQTAINRVKNKFNSQYLQFAQKQPIGSPEDYVVQDPYANQQANAMGITPAMKMMMETIAKTMAEQTIRKVLTEFTEQQRGKNYFEVYNKDQNIIRTADGKLYKLTPVQIKKK